MIFKVTAVTKRSHISTQLLCTEKKLSYIWRWVSSNFQTISQESEHHATPCLSFSWWTSQTEDFCPEYGKTGQLCYVSIDPDTINIERSYTLSTVQSTLSRIMYVPKQGWMDMVVVQWRLQIAVTSRFLSINKINTNTIQPKKSSLGDWAPKSQLHKLYFTGV